ncbi:hypothetical protein [Mycobacterium decipiens]|uniref:hypothetical protein n=1 Tax=Mycobacterium decipiens TaxID=1430326 RepID=UPI0013FDED1D|nr:hypothetical protein [Mycobacterium decipiens]
MPQEPGFEPGDLGAQALERGCVARPPAALPIAIGALRAPTKIRVLVHGAALQRCPAR